MYNRQVSRKYAGFIWRLSLFYLLFDFFISPVDESRPDKAVAHMWNSRKNVSDYCGSIDLRSGGWHNHTIAAAAPRVQHGVQWSETRLDNADLDREYFSSLSVLNPPLAQLPSSSGDPVGAAAPRKPLRVVCISDTHEYHRRLQLPAGDVLIMAGDIMSSGHSKNHEAAAAVIADFLEWFHNEVPRTYIAKFIIFGNHDDLKQDFSIEELKALVSPAIFLAGDEVYDVGGVRFFGSSWSPKTGSPNVSFQSHELLKAATQPNLQSVSFITRTATAEGSKIVVTQGPNDRAQNATIPPVDVLVVHGEHKQQPAHFSQLNPAVVVCGHYHMDRGFKMNMQRPCGGEARFDEKEEAAACHRDVPVSPTRGDQGARQLLQTFIPSVNASVLSNRFLFKRNLNPPIVFDVVPV